MCKNWQRDGGRAGSCYWETVALRVNSSVDRARVLAIADFRINPARVGMQTHMDLFGPRQGWEPMAMMMIKAATKRAKRRMGCAVRRYVSGTLQLIVFSKNMKLDEKSIIELGLSIAPTLM